MPNEQICTALELKSYQKWPVQLLQQGQKKFIINFPTGTGKTITAINAAEWLRNQELIQRIFVITPKSLLENFRSGFRVCYKQDKIPREYKLYTYTRFSRQPFSISPYRTLVIVDEAHNLRQPYSKRSETISRLVEQAEYAFLLTATPFINFPSDISNLINMISRPDEPRLPTDFKTFKQMFVDKPRQGRKKYIDIVKNKIITYIPSESTKPRVTQHVIGVMLLPEQIRTIYWIQKKKLTPSQLNQLSSVFFGGGSGSDGDNDSSDSDEVWNPARFNAFLTRVRQVSNVFVSVDEVDKLAPPPDNPIHMICGPKIERLVHRAVQGPKPVIIYSAFKGTGVDVVQSCLKKAGVPSDQIFIFSGHLTINQRKKLVSDYNHGQIKYLLITKAGAEGISLRGTRQIHILEPDWNVENIKQVIGRGVRMNSHTFLPPKQRHVDVYYWLGIVPKEMEYVLVPDPYIYRIATKKQKLNRIFQEYNQEASSKMFE